MPDVGGIAGARLKSFVERIERVEEEIKALNGDKKEIYDEARGTGFDVKIIKKIIGLRRKDQDELDEEDALLDVYMRALGMKPDLPSDEPVRAGARVPEAAAPVKASRAAQDAAKRLAERLAAKVAETIKDAGFVETGPGTFRAPVAGDAEPF